MAESCITAGQRAAIRHRERSPTKEGPAPALPGGRAGHEGFPHLRRQKSSPACLSLLACGSPCAVRSPGGADTSAHGRAGRPPRTPETRMRRGSGPLGDGFLHRTGSRARRRRRRAGRRVDGVVRAGGRGPARAGRVRRWSGSGTAQHDATRASTASQTARTRSGAPGKAKEPEEPRRGRARKGSRVRSAAVTRDDSSPIIDPDCVRRAPPEPRWRAR